MLSVSTSESKIVKSTSNWVSYTFLWLTTYQYLHCYVLKSTQKNCQNKCEKPFTLIVWPQPALLRQTGNPGEYESMGRQEFLSLHPQESQHCLARGDAEPGRCHTARFVFLFTFHQKSASPLMPFPWFHLPLAKRADTMKVHSRELIKSSCPL